MSMSYINKNGETFQAVIFSFENIEFYISIISVRGNDNIELIKWNNKEHTSNLMNMQESFTV